MLRLKAVAVLTALTSLTVAAAARAETCDGPLAEYTVHRIDADSFGIEARFNRPVSRLDLFFHPVAGRPEGQADSVRDLRAFDEAGRPIEIKYVGEAGWETPGEPARRISYRLNADHDQAVWNVGAPGKDEVAARFDHSYFFVGSTFFLADFGWPACPINIRFDLPEDWIVTSPWPMEGRDAVAMGAVGLTRNAFVMGTDAPQAATAGPIPVQWIVDSRIALVSDRAGELMATLPDLYTDFWGRAPVDQLTAVFIGDNMSDGGAFRNSFAMLIADPVSPVDEVVWSHTLGHELMHLWMGAGAIQSGPEIYWFTEGFTDYLTIKLMRRAGLISDERLAQRIANLLRRYELAKRLSPNIGLSEAGEHKRRNWELIYGGGALVALLMDAELSADDPDAFRQMLLDAYGDAGASYDQTRLLARLDASSGGLASETVSWIEGAPSFEVLRARLARAGIDATRFGGDEVYVAFPACGASDCQPAFLAGPTS